MTAGSGDCDDDHWRRDADTRFSIRADHRPTWARRCRTSEDDRRRQRITSPYGRSDRKFALRHSAYAEPSPKQRVAGSSPARGTKNRKPEGPRTKFTNTGVAVASLRIAVTQRIEQDGEWRDGAPGFGRGRCLYMASPSIGRLLTLTRRVRQVMHLPLGAHTGGACSV
jgi:hypothetical protein